MSAASESREAEARAAAATFPASLQHALRRHSEAAFAYGKSEEKWLRGALQSEALDAARAAHHEARYELWVEIARARALAEGDDNG